ncbi:hypothetical protein BVG19_g3400 [[Candida] boidinii]|nr:hypothetical protein BVG19_g3400 [[Candida] boidinii]OWB49129.1 hypothetical protein B5S27_g669 [[Candida] boidinii]
MTHPYRSHHPLSALLSLDQQGSETGNKLRPGDYSNSNPNSSDSSNNTVTNNDISNNQYYDRTEPLNTQRLNRTMDPANPTLLGDNKSNRIQSPVRQNPQYNYQANQFPYNSDTSSFNYSNQYPFQYKNNNPQTFHNQPNQYPNAYTSNNPRPQQIINKQGHQKEYYQQPPPQQQQQQQQQGQNYNYLPLPEQYNNQYNNFHFQQQNHFPNYGRDQEAVYLNQSYYRESPSPPPPQQQQNSQFQQEYTQGRLLNQASPETKPQRVGSDSNIDNLGQQLTSRLSIQESKTLKNKDMQIPIASSYLKKSPKEKDFISHNLNNNLKKNTSRSFFSLSSTPSPISQKFQSRKSSPPPDQPHNNDITATDPESSRSPSPSSGNTKNPRHERYNSVDQVLTTNIDEEMGTDKFENNTANGLYSRPTILKMANSTVGSSTQSSITASDTNSPDCIARNISTSPSSNISEAYNTDTTDKDNIGASTRNIDPSTNIKPDVNIAGQFSTVNNQSSSDISNNSGTDLSSNSNGISNNTATFDNKKQLFRENSIISPILTPGFAKESHDFLSRTLGDNSSSLVSTEDAFQLYSQNARKSKDPEVLLSYAELSLQRALSIKPVDKTEEKLKKKYLSEAHDALKRSSRIGLPESQYLLGDAYSVGIFGKPDLAKALSYFEIAGKNRHTESAYRAAVCYRKGWGCHQDARKSVRYMEIAAMNNHPVAMMEYGIYCFHGLMGLSDDLNVKKQGINWLSRATEVATELSCTAPYELALIHLTGFRDIVIQDTSYAIRLLFQAANLGHSKSASMLGKFYEIGDIVDANSDLSIHFYTMSALKGDVEGMMGLCSWYFVGTEHLEQDYDEAFAWALRAAEKGLPKAMLLLKRFYYLGIGCDKNIERSEYWGKLAEKLSNKSKK